MKLYRIAKNKYIQDLSGEGAKLYGGRWNHPGCRMLYCATSMSLSLLELMVHMDIRQLPSTYSSFEAEVPDRFIENLITTSELRADWRNNPPKEFTKDIGNAWIKSRQSVAALVPSAVLPSEYNVLVNPEHIDFKSFKLHAILPLNVDPRIWK